MNHMAHFIRILYKNIYLLLMGLKSDETSFYTLTVYFHSNLCVEFYSDLTMTPR